MSSALNTKRAVIIIGSISAAIVCASAAFRWYRKRRLSGRRKLSLSESWSTPAKRRLSPQKELKEKAACKEVKGQVVVDRESEGQSLIETSSSPKQIEMTTTVASFSTGESARGGRRDYRQYRRNRDEVTVQMNGCCALDHEGANGPTKSAFQLLPSQSPPSCISKHCQTANIYSDPAIVEASNGKRSEWDGAHQSATEAELRGAQLAAEFSAKCHLTNVPCFHGQDEEIGTNGMAHDAPPSPLSIKGQCAESPSLSSDVHSEGSQDSGKGASLGLTSSMSPVEEFIEIPAVYEFEVPQDIVGLLIGKQGTTIKWLTQESQAHIVIRQHFYSDRHKICTLEGTREQINKCLRLIRRKFPPSRFPDLKLTPIIPPPVTTSHTPVWDNVIQLHLPDGVTCEVVISSIVNAGHFFVQQPTHPTFSHLTRLDQYMLAVYNQQVGVVPPLPRPVDVGVICAAPILGGWYRAQTIEVYEDSDDVLVKFVDYGGYSRIPTSDLRQIRSDFMTLPFQATECYLAHVKPVSEKDGWSQEASSFFEQSSHGKVLEAAVVGHASDNMLPLVELYSTQDSKNVMINRLLADNGHAEWSE